MSCSNGCCYSAQEKRLDGSGCSETVRKNHARIFKILERFEGKKPIIDVERAKLFTESMMATEGQPLVLRWAKAMLHIAQNITVYIGENQLIAGRAGTDSGRYGILFPEIDGDFYEEFVTSMPNRQQCPFVVSDEDADIMVNFIAPYWKGKTFHEHLNNAFSPEVHHLTYTDDRGMYSRYVVNEGASYRSSLQWVLDYEKVLKHGFLGLKEDAQKRLDALDPLSSVDNTDKRPFLQSMIIICDAAMLWAKRHAELARQKAAACTDPVRKAELLQIAANCDHVPAHPARTFHEAVQAQWFTQAFSRLEQKTSSVVSNGRMDQYFYPYYKKDKEKGRLNDIQAMELIECVWMEMAQYIDMFISPTGNAFNEGYAHWEAVTVGGQLSQGGGDATNELSYLFLRSKRELPLNYPDLAVRVHSASPDRFLMEVAETIKDGTGYPKLLNDEEIIPCMLAKGARYEEVYDYAASGCSEARLPNHETYTSSCNLLNMPASVELVLYRGHMLKYGDEILGLDTGDPTSFTTWAEFWEAYCKQQRYLLSNVFSQQYVVEKIRPQHFATPLCSLLSDVCMNACKDLHSEKIEGGLDLALFDCIGYATLVDSLAAIKKLVFDDKLIPMSKLIEVLKVNFEGYENIRQMLLNAPKFGNNDPYVDSIARDVDGLAIDFTETYAKERGIIIDVRMVPITANVPFGRVTGATPNGRKAWTPLSDGASASHGADVNGPTAVLLSNYASKHYNRTMRASRLLNLKLSPKCVAGQEGTRKLVSMIRAFCDLKLWHLQFNIINRETLLAAQQDPEKYRSLLVRVAGYSAYFVDLSKDLQQDIIERTEHEQL